MPTMITNNYLWIIAIFVIPKEQNGTFACVLIILVGPIQFIPGFTQLYLSLSDAACRAFFASAGVKKESH